MSVNAETAIGEAGEAAERRCRPGDWVEIERVVLEPDERAEGLPPETAGKPLMVWVKGFAQGAAVVGEALTVETMSGRLVSGRLFAVNPGYYHTFGAPIAELTHVGRDLRARLAAHRAAHEQEAAR
ncbi:MAG: 2-amino-4-oxopentanoate thiolase subunit OrtA [Thermoleophilia bacterium]